MSAVNCLVLCRMFFERVEYMITSEAAVCAAAADELYCLYTQGFIGREWVGSITETPGRAV